MEGDKKSTNPRRNFSLIVASIRHPWSTRWHEIHGSPSSPAGSIRIQLSSFRNNCYRFPTAMLHFQVFTSASPLSSSSTVRPPFPTLPFPILFSLPLLSQPPLFLSSVSPYPPIYPLSFSALFQTRQRFTRDRPSSSASFSRRRARRLSRKRVFTSTP